MLANENNGNMREVYLDLAKNKELEDQINAAHLRQGGIVSEIRPGARGEWIVVITMPGEESIASGHLIGRRFGVYQPREPHSHMRRGRMIERMITLFPNYLFVHVWDVNKNLGRVLACTGVKRVLLLGDRPAIVPWALIDEIRAEENGKNPLRIAIDEVSGQSKSKKKRKKKRKNKKAFRKQAIEQAEVLAAKEEGHPNDVMATYSWGFTFAAMPEAERVSALHKALGLDA
jgi:hypothetical protein